MRLYGPPTGEVSPVVVLAPVRPVYCPPEVAGRGQGEHTVDEHPAITRQREQINAHARWRALVAHVDATGEPVSRHGARLRA